MRCSYVIESARVEPDKTVVQGAWLMVRMLKGGRRSNFMNGRKHSTETQTKLSISDYDSEFSAGPFITSYIRY